MLKTMPSSSSDKHIKIFAKCFLIFVVINAIWHTLRKDGKVFYTDIPRSVGFATNVPDPTIDNIRPGVLILMTEIIQRVDKLVENCVSNKYPDSERSARLSTRWNRIRLRETNPDESHIAYVINKDVELRVCLKDPATKEAESLNTAMFVVIHELAHLMSVSYGHNAEFWNNFKILLARAISLDIYQFKDYGNSTETYCGLKIRSTPCDNGKCSNFTM